MISEFDLQPELLYIRAQTILDGNFALQGPAPRRTSIISSDLTDLIVWHVVVASIVHIGCHVLSEPLLAKLQSLLAKIDRREEVGSEAIEDLSHAHSSSAMARGGGLGDLDLLNASNSIEAVILSYGGHEADAKRKAEAIIAVVKDSLEKLI